MSNCDLIASARAARGSDLPENHKSRMETRLANHHAQDGFFCYLCIQEVLSNYLEMVASFGTTLMTKTPKARDKLAHRSHGAPDAGKHEVLTVPAAEGT